MKMKRMFRWVVLALVGGMLGVSQLGFAQADAGYELPQGEWVIALSNSYFGNIWRKQMVEAFEEAAQQAKAEGLIADYVIVNGDGTQNQQIAQMNSLILRGVDGIAINAASPTALNGVIENAHNAGIKVLAFDSLATSPHAYKMDFDFVRLGELETEYVNERLNGEGNILIVRGVSGSAPDQEMYQGQMNVIEKNPGLKVVGTVQGEASTTVTQSKVSNILPSLPDVDAVLIQGGGDSYGVVQAFEASGKPLPIIIGGGDAEFINWWIQENEKSGYETFSISSSPGIGGAAFWLMLAILNGVEVPQEVKLPLLEVTQENLHEYSDMQPGTITSPTYTYDWVVENVIRAGQ